MPKVLIADDSRIQVHLLSGWLRDLGMETVAAFDAAQAFMLAIRNQPDVIVLDINMPAGSGIDVLKKLRASTKTMSIPVVVVSGTAGAEMRDLVKRLGASDLLEKPLEYKKFCDLVSALVPRTAGTAGPS